jgi:hypothetical protein
MTEMITIRTKKERLALLASLVMRGAGHANEVADIITPLFRRVVMVVDPNSIRVLPSNDPRYPLGTTVKVSINNREITFNYRRPIKKIVVRHRSSTLAEFDNNTPLQRIDSFVRSLETMGERAPERSRRAT